MAEQAAFVDMCKTMGDQIAGLTTTMGAQGIAKVVPSFDGDAKNFKNWVKSIEKYARFVGLDNNNTKLVAYQASAGPVSDFLKRYLDLNPGHDWPMIKAELQRRFGEIIDTQHAQLLLRKVKQKPGETIQVYAERLMTLGDDAFEGVPDDVKDKQMVNYFIDGLLHDFMKMKIMRENPIRLQIAIDVATSEQNLRKRFSLRTGFDTFRRDIGQSGDNLNEPMEVDNFRKSNRCFNCGFRGHVAKNCRKLVQAVSADRKHSEIQQNPRQNLIRCYNCQGLGHISRFCRNDRDQNNNRSRFVGNEKAPRN